MGFFSFLSPSAGIGELWKLNPSVAKPMQDLAVAIMRGESPLSKGDRELIAAFVSALNDCKYCFNGHAQIAVNFGVRRRLIDEIIVDIDSSSADEAFKPILHYVKKLTLTPSQMTQADADSVFAAAWSEKALQDAILVCCRFNFMNRLSLGHGLDPDAVSPQERAANMTYGKG
ncbi:MAG: peroxidase-related enzyme [Beijerinckiaceae bacterium]|nr:peroxidase-related enzyme [Beijerinckiaceae bacterium]